MSKLEERWISNTLQVEHIIWGEVASEKYHHYTKVLINQNDSKAVGIYIGKSASSTIALFNKHSDKLNRLETVTMGRKYGKMHLQDVSNIHWDWDISR